VIVIEYKYVLSVFLLLYMLLPVVIMAQTSFDGHTPIPLYIIHNQIQQQKEHLINEGTIYSMQLAHSIAAIVLLNSGNVAQTSIDALEFIETLKPLSIKGLGSIQVILTAPNEKYNGLLLVDIPNNKTLTKLPDIIVNKLKSTSTYSYISSNNIRYFEFVAQSPVAMGNIHCITRLLYNEDAVLKPVYRNYTIFVISTVIIIFLAVIFSLSFTRAFSRPIETMIQSIKQFDEGVPDIVLLDTILPGTSAFQVCETIRKNYSLHELPIIIMTSKHRTQEIITSFRVGANDYLSKPYNEEELIARIHNLIMLKRSVKEHNDYLILKHEIRLAHEIHNSVVIQNIPPLHNITIAHAYIPTRDMGGDFYDVIKIDDDKIGIMIADVTGHGIPAALVCAMLKMAFINNKEHAQHPARMLTLLNKDLSSTIHDNYITSAYSLINTKHKTITVSIAGHLPPLLLHNNGKVFKNWTRAFPIGWIEDAEYQETSIHYQHGDKFILYTDGVIELKKGKQIFGEDNVITFIANSFEKQPAILIEEMIKLLHDWSSIPADEPFKDDVTLLIAELL